jgi:outer membrane protein insertion porin family
MTACNSKFKIQNANGAWRRIAVCLHFAFCISHYSEAPAYAQDLIGQPIVEIVIEQEGQPVTDALIRSLIETVVGEPLSMRDVRETEEHLYNLRRFDDIQPRAEAVPGGVRLRYVLFPSHPVDRVEFRGMLGVSEEDLRRVVTDRFGRTPAAARRDEVAARLRAAYRDRGYPAAQVTARLEETHNPDRATLVLDIAAGRQARIADVRITQVEERDSGIVIGAPDIRRGAPYDADDINRQLRAWEERLKEQGYYEARASFAAEMPEDAYLFVNIARGPRVVVMFTGDPLPDGEEERLVPVRAEGSADEDLLEDAKLAIERYWQDRGYRDATASYARNDKAPGELQITFDIRRGPRYTIDVVRITGNAAFTTPELQEILQMAPGDLFVRSRFAARAGAIRAVYQTSGYTRADVQARDAVLPSERPAADERRVEVIVTIAEGPRTVVRSVAFEGNTVLGESTLRSLVPAAPGRPFSRGDVISGQDLIVLEYRNLGYGAVSVRQDVTLADGDTQADVRYTIVEGPQWIVDHIIVIGNTRTSLETIRGELLIREGGPAGYTAIIESRARLAALGLFRRVEVEEIEHTGEARRDVLVTIEEGDPTTFDFSGGLELGFRARSGPDGLPEDRLELVPRGSIGIGRRNLWGKNRSVNLFTRVSLRSTDIRVDEDGLALLTESNRGFNEFRVVGTFREPRLFSSRAELLVTGIVEQAVRTSFNFARRIARAEVGWAVSRLVSVTGRYSFERNKLFDRILRDDENPVLIDKYFPQVRISKFAASFIRETRDDLLDASRGMSVIADADLAARAIGSQVGFGRTFVQASTYKQLPTSRRIVAAFSGRVGVAHGFKRPAPDGSGEEVDDLPASERFFTGGDSSVRGFSLDRLATAETISSTGFPVGGNGVVILNGELRVSVRGAIQAVGFLDAGGIYRRASDIDLTELRPAVGFGLRYVIRRFGPLRLDWGFNLDRRELVPGARERGDVFHVSLGQAF